MALPTHVKGEAAWPRLFCLPAGGDSMKLSKVSFENYKIFKRRQEMEIRPFTILIGKNNSGKSAAARFPLIVNRGPRRRGGSVPRRGKERRALYEIMKRGLAACRLLLPDNRDMRARLPWLLMLFGGASSSFSRRCRSIPALVHDAPCSRGYSSP